MCSKISTLSNCRVIFFYLMYEWVQFIVLTNKQKNVPIKDCKFNNRMHALQPYLHWLVRLVFFYNEAILLEEHQVAHKSFLRWLAGYSLRSTNQSMNAHNLFMTEPMLVWTSWQRYGLTIRQVGNLEAVPSAEYHIIFMISTVDSSPLYCSFLTFNTMRPCLTRYAPNPTYAPRYRVCSGNRRRHAPISSVYRFAVHPRIHLFGWLTDRYDCIRPCCS